MHHMHAREHYSAVKRDEAMIYAVTEMNLENITLSEGGLSQKTTYYGIPLI